MSKLSHLERKKSSRGLASQVSPSSPALLPKREGRIHPILSPSLFSPRDNLFDLRVGLVHSVLGRQLAAVCFGKIDAERVLNFIPLRRTRPRTRTFQRAQLRRIRRELRHELRISEERFSSGWITALRGQLHLFAAGRPQ